MPRYDYLCETNGETWEVTHSINKNLTTWREVCELVGMPLGETSPDAPVRKVINTAPMASTPKTNADLKNMGFTKLVKRSDGVYENVTRTGTEERFMKPNDPSSIPHIHKKVSD